MDTAAGGADATLVDLAPGAPDPKEVVLDPLPFPEVDDTEFCGICPFEPDPGPPVDPLPVACPRVDAEPVFSDPDKYDRV